MSVGPIRDDVVCGMGAPDDETLANGGALAVLIDWTRFEGALPTVHCRCGKTFWSYHDDACSRV